MKHILGFSLMVSTRGRDPRTSNEMELKTSLVLAKVGLNEGGRRLDLMLLNLSSSWLLF